MESAETHSTPRNALLCVAGLAPQIITETLYGLAVQRDPAFVPDSIHVVTTQEGAERARLTLLDPSQGYFYRLCADYGLDPEQIDFSAETIHVIRDQHGQPLDDIRDPAHNEAAADLIVDLVRRLTQDPQLTLHASIAGGRKTMGYYLGYALSLFGRPQDELSHVLVSEPFEGHYQFFYPPHTPVVLYTREQKPIRTSDAEITLAQIPFVRLRGGLSDLLVEEGVGFSEAINRAQASLKPPRLELDLERLEIHCRDETLTLSPVNFAFYLWLARRARNGEPPVARQEVGPEYAQQFLQAYYDISNPMAGDRERVEKAVKEGMPPDYFDQRKSHVNRELNKLGPAAEAYRIQQTGSRPRVRYQLTLDPEKIEIRPSTRGP
ncbi:MULTISPECIES: CRISPR-associated ring nuclease Csm6 [Thioalkalivibrio]|uniref:CRISPR-associated protein n=1 Tax=Thioalkalivibrio halophilus TaxID=252474 RepID=A0A1V3A0G8_9GAMM|nr:MULTISPECIES: CRISPR-associated ring nuclease Csm6 [Thioalkalivibrio]OOC10842.1 CRISPR-associated protein [Thioalkalivibrio halophilus]